MGKCDSKYGLMGLFVLACLARIHAYADPVILDSQTVVTEQGSVTYERIVPPVLKPRALPVPPTAPVSSSAEPATEPSGPPAVQLMVTSRKVDRLWTEVRLPVGEGEAVFRTTLPMRHLDSLFDFTAGDREVFIFHLPMDGSPDETALAKERLLPLIPLPTQHIWTSKGTVPQDMLQAIEDLHRVYDAHQVLLTQSYFERETLRLTLEKQPPPGPKHEVVRYFPIRSAVR